MEYFGNNKMIIDSRGIGFVREAEEISSLLSYMLKKKDKSKLKIINNKERIVDKGDDSFGSLLQTICTSIRFSQGKI